MLKLLLSFLIVGIYYHATAQVVYPYNDIKLEKPSDYKATESMALSAANFLLTTPFVEVDMARGGALVFLNKWMTGTKDYQFYFQGFALEISEDKNLLSLFIAAMAKYTLENKAEAVNPLNTDRHAAAIVLAYCDDQKNNFKLKKKFRKLLEDQAPVKK